MPGCATVDREPAAEERLVAQTAGVRILDAATSRRPDGRPIHSLHGAACAIIIRKGVLLYTARGCTHLVGPGGIIVGERGEAYRIHLAFGPRVQQTVFRYLDARADAAEAPSSPDLGGRGSPVLPPCPRLEALHRLAWKAAVHTESGNDLATVVRLLSTLIARELAPIRPIAQGRPAHSPAYQRVSKAIHVVHERLRQTLSLVDLAAAAELSEFHFLRVFSAVLGLTPHQYLMRMRVRRALALIVETSLTEAAIAAATGWGSASHLTRTFHRQIGCTPAFFRSRSVGDVCNAIAHSAGFLDLDRHTRLQAQPAILDKDHRDPDPPTWNDPK